MYMRERYDMRFGPQPLRQKPPIERFLALTRINAGGCWDWLGSSNKDGYGQLILSAQRGKKRIRIAPYRFIWEWVNGVSMGKLEPDHLCNNRRCVNPQHIEPVTHAENRRRSFQRGRIRITRDLRKPVTHCKHGHEYTPENTRMLPSGSKVCRECARLKCRAYQAKRRATKLPG